LFNGIKRRWLAARVEGIRLMWQELDDRLLLAMGSEQTCLEIATAVEHALRGLGRHRQLEDMTDQEKRETAAMLRKAANKRAKLDPTGAYGFGIVCLWLESQSLPGEIAAEVRDEALEKINELLEGLDRYKEFSEKRRVELADKKAFMGDRQSVAVKLVMTIERWKEKYGPRPFARHFELRREPTWLRKKRRPLADNSRCRGLIDPPCCASPCSCLRAIA